jgi:mono/diheme cytochrome c family protein
MAAATYAQTKRREGDVEAGRKLALLACTGCHVVAPDQPFEPRYVGPPYPPSFAEIANRPDVTAASIQKHLETLPAVPRTATMPKPVLSSAELSDVAAFIVSLRTKP